MKRGVNFSILALFLIIPLVFNACIPEDDNNKAKYIFLFIGDGMGHGQIALTESYRSYLEGRLGGSPLSFTQFPVYGTCTTYSADHNITCSSAAGTAIACGVKTYNGAIGVDANKGKLTSLAKNLKEKGMSIGIISSCAITDATPAAQYAQ